MSGTDWAFVCSDSVFSHVFVLAAGRQLRLFLSCQLGNEVPILGYEARYQVRIGCGMGMYLSRA